MEAALPKIQSDLRSHLALQPWIGEDFKFLLESDERLDVIASFLKGGLAEKVNGDIKIEMRMGCYSSSEKEAQEVLAADCFQVLPLKVKGGSIFSFKFLPGINKKDFVSLREIFEKASKTSKSGVMSKGKVNLMDTLYRDQIKVQKDLTTNVTSAPTKYLRRENINIQDCGKGIRVAYAVTQVQSSLTKKAKNPDFTSDALGPAIYMNTNSCILNFLK
eukprot:TRINITY_DN3471_c0_g8_i2.p1 TRINITY_DN3471_c0_g8~~TRINITY_DN3471_c0_g8_i2.p1  ORF type:complete len:218 (-),score=19.92 TRINITY_DN3471_c0_g8_i2:354-1007(-)